MNQYVFFSPIGKSDPIRGNYDGPFLHILRYYKPVKAYIFLTKEMCEYHEKDNRYIVLGKRICPECEFIPIKYPDFDQPQDYEKAQYVISEALDRVCRENPDNQIIVNITSSTSQLTTALYIYAATSKRKLKLIQVITPAKAGNDTKPVSWDFDVESEWSNLFDNLSDMPGIENRCREIAPNNVRYQIACETIKSHIHHYDYYAALTTTKTLEEFFDIRTIHMIQAATHRISLDYGKAKACAGEAGYEFETVNKTKDARDIFEFLLYLKIKRERGDLSEFTRGVSPVLTSLFIAYLQNVHNFDIKSLCVWNKKGFYKLSREKIKPDELLAVYDQYFNGRFDDKPLAFSNILPALTYFCSRDEKYAEDLKRAERLREFEEKVRNMAAHQMVAITEDILEKDYEITSNAVFQNLKYFYTRTFKIPDQIPWDSYNRMNEFLEQLL